MSQNNGPLKSAVFPSKNDQTVWGITMVVPSFETLDFWRFLECSFFWDTKLGSVRYASIAIHVLMSSHGSWQRVHGDKKHRWISPKTSRFTRVPACSSNLCHSFPPSILRFKDGSVYLLQRKRIPQSISGPRFYDRRGTRRKRLRWPPHLSQAPHISSGRQLHKW